MDECTDPPTWNVAPSFFWRSRTYSIKENNPACKGDEMRVLNSKGDACSHSLSDPALTLKDKLARIQDDLGAAAHAELEARNGMDFAVYHYALTRSKG